MTARLTLAAVGVVIVGFVEVDQLWTTIAVGTGSGPMTSRVVGGLWGLALRHGPRRHRHRFLARVGVPIVMLTVTMWVLVLWLGWSLVFNAADTAVVASSTQAPASITERVYFTGYTIMTLGNGAYQPTGTFFELATVAASATGFFVVTLSITYLVPVVSAIVGRRQLASQIGGLGRTPEELVIRAWSGDGFPALPLQFVALSSAVSTVAEQHLAYPMVRVFHSKRRATATSPAVAVLAEAVTLLQYGVAPQCRPPAGLLLSLGAAIEDYMRAVPADLPPPAEPPPGPELAALYAAGIPTLSNEQFTASLDDLRESRCRLSALVHSAGWSWHAVADS